MYESGKGTREGVKEEATGKIKGPEGWRASKTQRPKEGKEMKEGCSKEEDEEVLSAKGSK